MAAAKVKMFDPVEDRVVDVAPADVRLAQEEGLLLETADTAAQREYEQTAGLGEALKAGAEGLASGATLGLSDVALSAAFGDDYREGRLRRQEAFGGLETLGEVAGGVLPVLLSGGSGAVARGASLAPSALAARAAAGLESTVGRGLATLGAQGAERGVLREVADGALRLAAGGVAEGSLAGAGMALSEAALANELGGFDAVAERAWAGAKSGAMLGLIGGAALGGVAGAAKGGARGLARRFAQSGDDLAEAANERAIKALDPRGTEVRKLGTDAKIQQIGQDLRDYRLRDGTPVLDWVDSAEDIAPKVARAKGEVTQELGALRARVAADTAPVDALAYIRQVDEEVVRPLLDSPSPTIKRYGKRVENEFRELAGRVGRGEDVTYADLLRQQRALKEVAYPKKPPGQGLPSAPPTWAEHIAKSERILESTMEDHVEKTLARFAPDELGRYAELRRLSESFIKADTILKKSTKQNLGNRAVSLTDYLTGMGAASALFDGGASVVGGLAAAGVHKLARERGSAMLATLYTRAKAADLRMNRGLDGYFKRAREAVQQTRIATGGAATGQAVAFDVRRALRAQANEDETDAYDRVVARAQAVVQGKAVGPFVLDEVAPQTGHAMRAVQQRAAAHLVRTAPVPPRTTDNPNLGALAGDMKPDPVALYEWSRRVAAIDDPYSILDDLEQGTISMAAVEAVREVYPLEYANMQARVMDGLAGSKQLLSYEHRIKLGVLFDLPTDQTLRPEYLQLTQAIYAQPEKPPAPIDIPSGGSGISKRAASTAERLADADAPM